MCPPGSADTVCPRPPLMTQVQHFFPELRRDRDETYRRCELITVTFDFGDHHDCRSYASWNFVRVPSANFCVDYSFSICGLLGQHGSDWSRDLVTLTFNLAGDGASAPVADAGRPPSVYIVWSSYGLAIRKIWRTMSVSINGPGGPDLRPFDLETGMLIGSKAGNLPSKFGHAKPLGSRSILYVRDGWTDGRTKATLSVPFPTYGGGA